MLIIKPLSEESQDQKQGKMLLLTEYSLLSLLHDTGIVTIFVYFLNVSSLFKFSIKQQSLFSGCAQLGLKKYEWKCFSL